MVQTKNGIKLQLLGKCLGQCKLKLEIKVNNTNVINILQNLHKENNKRKPPFLPCCSKGLNLDCSFDIVRTQNRMKTYV